ncbi:hypothetical protein, partial [Variovorax sp. JS1663]|uniref:hypothetical protein n=1 Tax=Variovorax sp. JS1663 TaxID=1851577 RepID=UPI00130247FF
LAQVISDFKAHRALGSNADLFADAGVRARYDRLKDLFKEGAAFSLAQIDAEMLSLTQSLAQHGSNTEAAAANSQLYKIRSCCPRVRMVNPLRRARTRARSQSNA